MFRSTAFQGTARMTAGLVAAVVLATPALAAGSTQAQRQPRCIDRQMIEEVLKQRFAEKQAGIGLAEDGRLLEVFSSPDGRTWTSDCDLGSRAELRDHLRPDLGSARARGAWGPTPDGRGAPRVR